MIGRKKQKQILAFIEHKKRSGESYSLMEGINTARNIIGLGAGVHYEQQMKDCLDMMGFPSMTQDDVLLGTAMFKWCQVNLTFKDYVRYGKTIYFQYEDDVIRTALCYGEYLGRGST